MRMIKLGKSTETACEYRNREYFEYGGMLHPRTTSLPKLFFSLASGEKACIRRFLIGTENLFQKRVISDSETGSIVSIKTLLVSAVDLFGTAGGGLIFPLCYRTTS